MSTLTKNKSNMSWLSSWFLCNFTFQKLSKLQLILINQQCAQQTKKDKILFVANLIKVNLKSIGGIPLRLQYLVKLLGYPVNVHYVLQIPMATLQNKHKENKKTSVVKNTIKVIQSEGVQTVAMSRSARELLKPVSAAAHRRVESRRWRNQTLWAFTTFVLISLHTLLEV